MNNVLTSPANEPVKKARKRRTWIILFCIMLLPALGMGLSTWMYFSGYVPEGRTNNGSLILPPLEFSRLNLTSTDIAFGMEELDGRWALMIVPDMTLDSTCSDDCEQLLYLSRQAHIALARESDRVVRLFVQDNGVDKDMALEQEHPAMEWLNTDLLKTREYLLQKAKSSEGSHLYIVDPLGNIMMHYTAEHSGNEILRDIQKLLKLSQIG
ncbi:hypothetical protein ACWJJH_14470 [Endozoicomonadaceae bacterium StTr2]